MAEVAELKEGLGNGDALLRRSQEYGQQVLAGLDKLTLEAVVAGLGVQQAAIAGMIQEGNGLPIGPANGEHAKARSQYDHTLTGAARMAEVDALDGALNQQYNQLDQAEVRRRQLVSKLQQWHGLLAGIIREIEGEGIPLRAQVESNTENAGRFAQSAINSSTQYASRL